jgi:hypothetical protein
MKKEIKNTKPTPSPADPITHNEEMDDEFYPLTLEQQEAANEFFAAPLLHSLGDSKSAEEFYVHLREIILDAHKLSNDERQWLANIVQKPWKPKRGAGTKEERYREIFDCYILGTLIGDAPELRRADAIREIMDRYKITADAAGKSYDIYKKWYGQAPPPKK